MRFILKTILLILLLFLSLISIGQTAERSESLMINDIPTRFLEKNVVLSILKKYDDDVILLKFKTIDNDTMFALTTTKSPNEDKVCHKRILVDSLYDFRVTIPYVKAFANYTICSENTVYWTSNDLKNGISAPVTICNSVYNCIIKEEK